mmetsp:Transcript_36840/g.99026  ORF Transcript_36840/g.99026 Transcript_36840/m.99026 type:complete len:111 (+) Transcript_36840:578-910(+)
MTPTPAIALKMTRRAKAHSTAEQAIAAEEEAKAAVAAPRASSMSFEILLAALAPWVARKYIRGLLSWWATCAALPRGRPAFNYRRIYFDGAYAFLSRHVRPGYGSLREPR